MKPKPKHRKPGADDTGTVSAIKMALTLIIPGIIGARMQFVCSSLPTLFALGVNGNSSEAGVAEEFSLSRILMSKGLKKGRLARGVELSTADMRAAFALRRTTDGLMLRRSVRLDAFLGLGPVPVLLALGPAGCGNAVSGISYGQIADRSLWA